MFLYQLSLQKGTNITHCIHGNFSGTKQQVCVPRHPAKKCLLTCSHLLGRSGRSFPNHHRALPIALCFVAILRARASLWFCDPVLHETQRQLPVSCIVRVRCRFRFSHSGCFRLRAQLIAVARGTVLEIFRPDSVTGKMFPLLAVEVFGVIRSLVPFRLTGASKPHVWDAHQSV